MDGEPDDSQWQGGHQGVEGLSKKEKGLMDMDNNVVISGEIWEINGNGKIQ